VAVVPGVIDYYVTENYTGSPVTTGGVTLAANSLYVCVSGGLAASVAQAIWTKKNPGCAYNGNTTVTVYDTNSGYSPPYPSYSVTYETPTDEAICFQVTIANSSGVPSNALALIGNAIQSGFLGQDGGTRARIGSEIFASRYYGDVALLGSWALIISILIGTNASPTASFTGVIAATTLTVSGSVTGTIAVGQFVYGANVMGGTVITALGSGTGGDGTYTVSVNQSAGSEAMTSVAPVNYDVTMHINQIPTLNWNASTGTGDVSLILV
jgi:hypothetical protein